MFWWGFCFEDFPGGEGGGFHFIRYLFFILLGGIRIRMPKNKIKSFLAAVGRGGKPPQSKFEFSRYGIDVPRFRVSAPPHPGLPPCDSQESSSFLLESSGFLLKFWVFGSLVKQGC